MEEIFRFRLDADVVKSEESDGGDSRIIRGYASTEQEDRQGEQMVQKGLDFSDFVNHGYFNYDHNNSIILGYPLDTCKVDDNGFWVEGVMLKGIPEADRIWNLANVLKKSKAPRRVGFSVEGKILEREGSRIKKAKIYNVAITTNPVNTNCTWETVAKSFNTMDMIDTSKSLEAGYETNPLEMEGGGVFRKEDIDRGLKNLSYVIDDDKNKKILKEKLSTKKSLSKRELILYLQLYKGWSLDRCKDFITKIAD